MRILTSDQGSEQWHLDRAGVITASKASAARKKLVSGELTMEAKRYAFRLAVERIAGMPLDDTYQTLYMHRGNRLEVDARLIHEQRIGDLIVEVGLVVSDCGNYGASADGFIGEKGGSEYKCFVEPSKLMDIWLDADIKETMDQIQMNMWLSGREWWHFGLYCPVMAKVGRELTIIPVVRDDAFIASMVADLEEFNELVESYKIKILENNPDSIWMPGNEIFEPENTEYELSSVSDFIINL
jgi:hypothetical protein